jgi:hypothetical protein
MNVLAAFNLATLNNDADSVVAIQYSPIPPDLQ